MDNLKIIKEIYMEAFKQLENFVLKTYMKFFAWFSFIMFGVVLYAFIYRVITGFPFD